MEHRILPAVETGSGAFNCRRIVLADREIAGSVHIENGLIVGVEEDRVASNAVDLGDDILIPGLVELHTDHLEPHYSPRPNVIWDPFTAVFGYDAQIACSGITTVFDSLRAGSDADRHTLGGGLLALGEAIENAKVTGLLRADHHTHLRCEICSEDVLEEAEKFLSRYDVRLMSLMDHTPGARQFRDESKLREYYRIKGAKTDAELDLFFSARKEQYARLHDLHRSTLVRWARDEGVALASHDDTTEIHVQESLADGVAIAEFPTTVEAAAASHAAGLSVLMGAPNVVRGGSHSGNVSAVELAEAGVLDILSSDYVPISLIQGAFALAPIAKVGGLPGAIRTVTKNPALATGLDDRGEIAVGKRADFVRVAWVNERPVVREVYRQGLRVA
ncbi:alpha-D-ribose 1-methylphosphonate 5-triphosphate diphosphatase [Terrarubrum flagellatum]|uniref:alpha-D-ribose 1-methylphosphonate 5-triphosphate diphosphatase n=1 Tax=Terrirubrum flagellatum TaxID=2895980 RepID=UPI0031455C8F